jgi:hypothetical protein
MLQQSARNFTCSAAIAGSVLAVFCAAASADDAAVNKEIDVFIEEQ